jgi:hypothetical protein
MRKCKVSFKKRTWRGSANVGPNLTKTVLVTSKLQILQSSWCSLASPWAGIETPTKTIKAYRMNSWRNSTSLPITSFLNTCSGMSSSLSLRSTWWKWTLPGNLSSQVRPMKQSKMSIKQNRARMIKILTLREIPPTLTQRRNFAWDLS